MQIYAHQYAPFRSKIFTIFFALGGEGALTPLIKILRTFLDIMLWCIFVAHLVSSY